MIPLFRCGKAPAIETAAPPFVPPDDVTGIYEGFYGWDSTLLGGGSNFSYPDNVPMAPRMRTVPLPSVVPGDITRSDGDNPFPGGNDSYQTSLATAKPNIIENDTQSEVSGFFYPAEDHALR